MTLAEILSVILFGPPLWLLAGWAGHWWMHKMIWLR